MRLNMKTNRKVIVSAAAVAALLVAPAMAKQVRPSAIPNEVRASVAASGMNESGPYTPSIQTQRYGTSLDFQGGGGNK
jgi:hypothetical protein